jgi:tetratricopeptide (TPR) repeat protein
MKNVKLFCCIFTLSLLAFQSKAMSISNITPPDSTTSVMDRSSALVMIEQGKKLYSERKNREALIVFREASQKDPNSWKPLYWISMCHYNLDNYGFALQYGMKTIKMDAEAENDIYELIAKSHHRMGNIDSAIHYYEIAQTKLSKMTSKDMNISRRIMECNFAKQALSQKPFAEKQKMEGEINSGYNEYAPIILNSGKEMYFTSRRNNTTGGSMNPEDEQYFEDVYHAKWNEETASWDSISNQIDRINGPGFESFSWVSKDGLTAIMTLNNEAVEEGVKTQSSDIFEVLFTDKGKWSNPKKIKAVNSTFFDGAASLTGDGNTMYFVSTRNGEKKQFDIYVSHKNGKTWGEPTPVSDSINTTGSETTPFITADGRYLFFSSDGHLGMGGYDIFVSENLGNTWSKPVNLGSAINTVNNDTHFQYYPELKKAVFAAFVLQGQKASMDIFQIDTSNFKIPSK